MKDRPTLDTSWFKSGWIVFWIAPFALFAVVGFFLVGADVIQNGFDDPWWRQATGLTMLLGFGIALSLILVRGISRDRIWITSDSLRIQHSGLLRNEARLLPISTIAGFELAASDILFDLSMRGHDGTSVPIIRSLSTKKMEHWTKALAAVAPVRLQSAITGVKSNEHNDDPDASSNDSLLF